MNVLVIGAGVIGAAVANELAARGATVTVLDMRAPGRGASWASAGLLAPYTEAHAGSPLLRMGVRSLAMFDDLVERIRARSGRHVEYARNGTFEVALTADDEARLRAAKAWLDSARVASEWIDPRELGSFEPSLTRDARGGLLIPTHGFVGVGSFVGALLQSARFAGAIVESPVEAVDVVSRPGDVQIRAGERRYVADRVVIAAGSWSSRVKIQGAPQLPVRPVRGQLLHLRWTTTVQPSRPLWSAGCYTVPWSDGTLLVGATVEEVGFDESTTVAGITSLTTAVTRMLPAAAGASLIDARAGLRPATPDGLPYIGTFAATPNVMVATGHYRNGILLAPLTAVMVADAVLDGRVDAMMEEVAPDRRHHD